MKAATDSVDRKPDFVPGVTGDFKKEPASLAKRGSLKIESGGHGEEEECMHIPIRGTMSPAASPQPELNSPS